VPALNGWQDQNCSLPVFTKIEYPSPHRQEVYQAHICSCRTNTSPTPLPAPSTPSKLPDSALEFASCCCRSFLLLFLFSLLPSRAAMAQSSAKRQMGDSFWSGVLRPDDQTLYSRPTESEIDEFWANASLYALDSVPPPSPASLLSPSSSSDRPAKRGTFNPPKEPSEWHDRVRAGMRSNLGFCA
jgi:hypothetical protein